MVKEASGKKKMLQGIKRKFRAGKYEYSLHATNQSILRHIGTKEILEAIENGIIIEDYPEDKYGPSCLMYGMTVSGKHLHVQCSYPSRHEIKIITVYEPGPEEWEDYVRRKTK